MTSKKLLQYPHIWLIIILLFSLGSLLGDVINERFDLVDFEVYYRTAERMWQGQPIYRIEADGHFVYKYAPTAAVFFMPFLLLGFPLAKVVFWLLSTAVFAGALYLLTQLASDKKTAPSQRNLYLIVAVLAVVPHIHLEWHLGQVNVWLLALYVCLIWCYQAHKDCLLGGLLALSLFVKPFGLIFIPFLLWKKRYKALVGTFVQVTLLAVLPFLFYWEWGSFVQLYQGWMNELAIELGNKQDLLAAANHTFVSVLARYSPIQFWIENETFAATYKLGVLLGLGALFLWYMQRGWWLVNGYLGNMTLLIAWIPLLAFTSQNAFIFCLPLIIYLLFRSHQMPRGQQILLFVACLCIGVNMYELVAKEAHQWLMDVSVYTFGGILLTVLACLERVRASRVEV